jgi:hypothetical protein
MALAWWGACAGILNGGLTGGLAVWMSGSGRE